MERIGERLRRRREELGLTIEDVSESIRYRPEVIRFIEEGRSSVFPAKAYLSAFLRAYAVILELDPQRRRHQPQGDNPTIVGAILEHPDGLSGDAGTLCKLGLREPPVSTEVLYSLSDCCHAYR